MLLSDLAAKEPDIFQKKAKMWAPVGLKFTRSCETQLQIMWFGDFSCRTTSIFDIFGLTCNVRTTIAVKFDLYFLLNLDYGSHCGIELTLIFWLSITLSTASGQNITVYDQIRAKDLPINLNKRHSAKANHCTQYV